MKREPATAALEEMLGVVATSAREWPLDIIEFVAVFGSYARGSTTPGDVDLAVGIERGDERWTRHMLGSLSSGRDPYAVLRMALRGRRRSISIHFEPERLDDIAMTTLWRRGEGLGAALDRVRAIPSDPRQGRAERDAMLPVFEGVDQWVPRALREELIDLLDRKVLRLERIDLEPREVQCPASRELIEQRWGARSPLRRAAHAAMARLEDRGVDLTRVHLHGRDTGPDRLTPFAVGFQLRYLRAAMRCFAEYGVVEWLEVLHPTRSSPLTSLAATPGSHWRRLPPSPQSFFS